MASQANIIFPAYGLGGLPSVPTIAGLRAYDVTSVADGENIVAQSGTTVGDKNGGLFSWAASSLANDDGASVIRPNSIGPLIAGRWLAVIDNNPTVDLSGVYDGSTAFTSFNGSRSFQVLSAGTPTNYYQVNVGAYPATQEIPSSVLQGFVSKVAVPSSYTGTPWPVNSISAYSLSANNVAGNSNVGVFSFAGSQADGVNPYAFNAIITNADRPIYGTKTGHEFQFLCGLELDFNIAKKPDGSSPGGFLYGILLTGASEAGTTGYHTAFGLEALGGNGSSVPWRRGLHFRAGATLGGIQLDPTAWTGTGLYSQPLVFYSGAITDGNSDSPPAGALPATILRGDPSGNLEITPGNGNVVVMGTGEVQANVYKGQFLRLAKVTASTVTAGSADYVAIFVDIADGKLKRKDNSGTVTIIG